MAEDDRPTAGREEEQDEDEALPDWGQFAKLARAAKGEQGHAAPFIPRRGEKDFEPITLTASSASESALLSTYQLNLLAESRNNLYAAISSGQRSHSSRYHNSFTWRPDLDGGRAVSDSDTTYGIHFATMGRFHPLRKRVELLPEEALFLLERGTIELWSQDFETEARVPMTVQQAWAQLIGSDELTIERFQIYAQLKRMGFSVLRARRKEVDLRDTFEPKPPLWQRTRSWLRSLLVRCWAVVRNALSRQAMHVTRQLHAAEGRFRSLIHGQRWSTYNSIFARLQIVPAGHDLPVRSPIPFQHSHPARQALRTRDDASLDAHPYQIFWHVYKPITKFKKSKPPAPDFQIVVIDAATTPMPDMFEFTALFDTIPLRAEKPAKRPPPQQPTTRPSFVQRVRSLMGLSAPAVQPRKPSPYPRLKVGCRDIIVAISDNGTTSYVRFSQSEFAKLPWHGPPRSA